MVSTRLGHLKKYHIRFRVSYPVWPIEWLVWLTIQLEALSITSFFLSYIQSCCFLQLHSMRSQNNDGSYFLQKKKKSRMQQAKSLHISHAVSHWPKYNGKFQLTQNCNFKRGIKSKAKYIFFRPNNHNKHILK